MNMTNYKIERFTFLPHHKIGIRVLVFCLFNTSCQSKGNRQSADTSDIHI